MIDRFHGTPLLHAAVHHGDTVYLCGATAEDRSVGMGAQTTQVLEKVAKWLKHFGSDRAHMLNAMIYITDMNQIEEMNDAWATWFDGKDQPTRAAIGVADLGPDVLIELVVTAAKI